MREILFRGKRLDNGEWVEGDLVQICDGRRFIVNNRHGACIDDKGNFINTESPFVCKVAPATVGQYTGLMDKNGKRIFEGDVVAQNWYDFDEPADDSFGEVVFSVADCSFSILDFNKNEIMAMGPGCAYHWEAEVIGNIHDNPELLKDGEG